MRLGCVVPRSGDERRTRRTAEGEEYGEGQREARQTQCIRRSWRPRRASYKSVVVRSPPPHERSPAGASPSFLLSFACLSLCCCMHV